MYLHGYVQYQPHLPRCYLHGEYLPRWLEHIHDAEYLSLALWDAKELHWGKPYIHKEHHSKYQLLRLGEL